MHSFFYHYCTIMWNCIHTHTSIYVRIALESEAHLVRYLWNSTNNLCFSNAKINENGIEMNEIIAMKVKNAYMFVKWCVHEGKGLKCDKRIEKVCEDENLQMNVGNVTEKKRHGLIFFG